MDNQPLVSVLMTVYNRSKYIAEAIESVIKSTYTNWELIITDNCSIDNSLEIAKSYEQKDSRIKVYKNETNIGQFPNRNKAADYAKGKYLKYVDADDLLYPHGLEILVYHMEKFPEAGYGLCSLPQDDDRMYPFMLSPQEAYYRHYLTKKWIFHKAPLSSIIKKDTFSEVDGFTDNRILGDFAMWNKLSIAHNVVLLPGDAVWYRVHEEQEMKKAKVDVEVFFQYLTAEEDFLSSESCPLNENDKIIALKKSKRKQARYILRIIKSHGLKSAIKLQKKSGMNIFAILKNAF